MEDLGFQNVRMVCDEYGKEYVAYLKTLMQKKNSNGYNRVASGKMLASLKTTTEQQGSVFNVMLHHKDYMKYLEEGTSPHWPPTKPINDWIKNKKIPVHSSRGDKLPTEKQLSFLIRRKIAAVGTEGEPLMQEANKAMEKIYTQKLRDALDRDVKYIYDGWMVDFKGFFDFE